jgi:glyoxalase/bleomycin resistance protein/dioxygenase superfamily protein
MLAATANGAGMISGVHAIVFSKDAAGVRSFFRDVLQLPAVDAGDGWLIFALPPAELAVHPTEGTPQHELYLMCDDINGTIEELAARGISTTGPVSDQGWGLLTGLKLPDRGEIGLYEPRHPSPLQNS